MKKVKDDLPNEGRSKGYNDVDRMIDEGLAGGTLHSEHALRQIDEAREINVEEDPPYKAE